MVLMSISQKIWREFSHNLLWYFPNIHNTPIKNEFEKFEWDNNEANLIAWKRG